MPVSMKKPPKEEKDLVSAASKGGFFRYFKCKVFAIFLAIREKGGFRSVLSTTPALRPKYAILAGLGNQSVTLTRQIPVSPTSFSRFPSDNLSISPVSSCRELSVQNKGYRSFCSAMQVSARQLSVRSTGSRASRVRPKSSPPLFVVGTNAYQRQLVRIDFGYLLQLRLCHATRTASHTPKVEQDVAAFQLGQ